jgi:hypothetical protein
MSEGFAATVFLTTDDAQSEYEALEAPGGEFIDKPE